MSVLGRPSSGLLLDLDRRARLSAAVLGTQGRTFVTILSGDLKACLIVAEAAQEALELLGENEALKRTVIARSEQAAQVPALLERIALLEPRARQGDRVPALEDRLTAAKAHIDALTNRITQANRMLRGEA